MSYRKRLYGSKKFNERLKNARRTRLQNRLELPDQHYPVEIPKLRRRVVVEDYDFGEVVRHEILLYRSNRIDCYKVCVDGNLIANRLGWARGLEMIRKAFVRVGV